MNTLFKTLCVLGITLLVSSSYHTLYAQTAFDKGIQSPTAASLGEYGNEQISLYTGKASKSIPLGTLNAGNYALNIGLSYNYNGFKPEIIPGSTGLGWALNAGGVITRTVQSIRDEDDNGYSKSAVYTAYQTVETNNNLLEDVIQGNKDAKPDMFYFNVNGMSGRFFYDKYGNFQVDSYRNLIIDWDITPGNELTSKFTITDIDGTIYKFGGTSNEVSQSKTEVLGDEPSVPSVTDEYVTAWYLTEIKTVNGESINFQYTTVTVDNPSPITENANYVERKIYTEEVKSTGGPNSYSQIKTWDLKRASSWVNQITNNTQTITINYSSRTDFTDQKKVESVVFSTNNSANTYDFTYDYLGTTGVNSRLILTDVDMSASSTQLPGWHFDYYGEGSSSALPDITSLEVDFWGYYNAEVNNDAVYHRGLPEHYYLDEESGSSTYGKVFHFPGMNLNPDHSESTIGLMKTISYPTGGTAEYKYEANSYSYIADLTQQLYDYSQDPGYAWSVSFERDGSTYTPTSPYHDPLNTIVVTGTQTVSYILNTSFIIDPSTADCSDPTIPQVPGEDPGPECYGSIVMKNLSGGSDVPILFETDGVVNLPPGTYSAEFTLNSDAIDDLENAVLEGILFTVDITPFAQATAVNELPGPGHRVEEITIKDGLDDSINQVRKFDYVDLNSPTKSSGALVSEIKTQVDGLFQYTNYDFISGTEQIITDLIRYRSSGSVMPLGSTQGSPMGYSHVQETIITVDGNNTREYEYHSPRTYPDANPPYPIFQATTHDYGRGSLKSVENHNASDEKISSKSYQYSHTTKNNNTVGYDKLSPRWELRRLGYIGGFGFVPSSIEYNLPVWSRTVAVYENIFEGGVQSSNKNTTTSYNSDNHQPETVIEASGDYTKRTTYQYAHEVYNATGEMEDLNMLTQPYSVLVETTSDQISWDPVGKSWTLWSNTITGAPTNSWQIEQLWTWNGSGNDPATPSEPSSIRNVLATEYDDDGNPIEFIDASGTTTKFYYGTNSAPFSQSASNNSRLTGIQKVIGTEDAIPGGGTRPTSGDDLFTEAEYGSLDRVSKIISENGVENTFTYDSFGRLTASYNNAGVQVASHSYSLTGSSFSETNPNWVESTTFTSAGNRVSRQYMDGIGRSVQQVTASGSEVIISAQSYNDRGKPWKSYKPFSRSGTSMSFDTVTDSAAKAKFANQDAFTITEYEDSPLQRAEKAVPLGGETSYGSVTTTHDVENIDGGSEYFATTTTTDQEGNVTKTYTDGWGRTIRTVSDPAGINAITGFVYDELDRLLEVRPPNYFSPPTGSVANDWIITYTYDTIGNLTSKTSNDFGTVNYAYDKANRLRFSQDANQAAANQVAYTVYDVLGRIIESGIADYTGSFSTLDPDSTYNFESTDDYQKGAYAYDAKPSTSAYPWSEFSTEITNFSMDAERAKGQLVADMYRFRPEPLEANVDTSGLGISGAETYRAIDTLSISTSDMLSGSNVVLEAGKLVILKEDVTAFDGSEVVVSIDENLIGTDSVGVNSQTGTNPWQLQLYSYDSEGRVATKKIYTGSQRDWDVTISYVYNRLGEVTRRKVEIGEDALFHHYVYDELGRLSSVTLTADGVADTETAEITYSYEADGSIEEKQYKGGTTFDYQYDIQSRLTKINDPAASSHVFSAAYTYFDNGNIEEAEFYNPLTSLGSDHYRYKYTHTYDKLNRLTSATYSNYASSSWATTNAFKVNTLAYDKQGNITSLNRYDDAASLIDNLSYSYAANNRLTGITDVINTTSETWDVEDATYGYDANGNMTSKTGKFSTLVYNEFNLPIQIETTAGKNLKANYNGAGERILKEFSEGTWTYYIRDGGETLATLDQAGDLNFNLIGMGTEGQLLGGVVDPVIDLTGTVSTESESNDTQATADGPIGLSFGGDISLTNPQGDWVYFEVLRSGTVTITKAKTTGEYSGVETDLDWTVKKSTTTVATGNGSGSFSVTPGTYHINLSPTQGLVADYYDLKLSAQASTEYATRYFLKDHLGSTRAIVDEIGTHLASYDYYPFGLEMPGRVSTSSTQIDPYKYTGHERDEESGINLDYMLARGYDPTIGRFLQIDPLASAFASWTPYHYVYNNPLNLVDPTGMFSCDRDANNDCDAQYAEYSNAKHNSLEVGMGGSFQDQVSQIFPVNNNQTSGGHVNPGTGSPDFEKDKEGLAIAIAKAILLGISVDLSTPDPTDLAPPKYVVEGALGAVAIAVLAVHGNSNKNKNEHLVYEIFSTNILTGEMRTEKYGITSRKDNLNGGNGRPGSQVNRFNREGDLIRIYGWREITRTNGRVSAKAVETLLVTQYVLRNSKMPPRQIRPFPKGPGSIPSNGF